MLDYTGCRNTQVLFLLAEILWNHNFLSDVTGSRKIQVSDYTSSTVFIFCLSNCRIYILYYHWMNISISEHFELISTVSKHYSFWRKGMNAKLSKSIFNYCKFRNFCFIFINVKIWTGQRWQQLNHTFWNTIFYWMTYFCKDKIIHVPTTYFIS
jgi:hypothetical protein